MLLKNRPRITVRGFLNGETSYGLHTEMVTSALIARDWCPSVYPVQIQPEAKCPKEIVACIVRKEQQEEWEIRIQPPQNEYNPDKKVIYCTTWETTRLRKSQVDNLNKAKAIIVPCEFNAYSFSASGVNVPIYWVPHGMNEKVFNYRPQNTAGKFTIAVAGKIHGQWSGRDGLGSFTPLDDRKNFKMAIDAFQKAFPKKNKNVALKIKGFPGEHGIATDDPRIEVVDKFLTQRELVEFYASSNVFLSTSKMEGWGWMQQESMAMGRPLIAPITGGIAEFANRENSFAVGYSYTKSTKFYEDCGLWTEPDLDSMVSQLRRAKANPEEVAEKGIKASASASRFTFERFADTLDKTVKEIIQTQEKNERKQATPRKRPSPTRGRGQGVCRRKHAPSGSKSS